MGGKSSGELHLTPPLYATARERRCGGHAEQTVYSELRGPLYPACMPRMVFTSSRTWEAKRQRAKQRLGVGRHTGALARRRGGGGAARLEGERSRAAESERRGHKQLVISRMMEFSPGPGAEQRAEAADGSCSSLPLRCSASGKARRKSQWRLGPETLLCLIRNLGPTMMASLGLWKISRHAFALTQPAVLCSGKYLQSFRLPRHRWQVPLVGRPCREHSITSLTSLNLAARQAQQASFWRAPAAASVIVRSLCPLAAPCRWPYS